MLCINMIAYGFDTGWCHWRTESACDDGDCRRLPGDRGGASARHALHVLLMEMTSRDALKPFLDAGFDTVGTLVNVSHLAATPMGMSVTIRAEVTAVDDRKIRLKVEAYDEKEKIGEGVHERFVVNVAKFASRLQAKRES